MSAIRFGTDGWRAIIADEFTFANIRLVTQAIVLITCIILCWALTRWAGDGGLQFRIVLAWLVCALLAAGLVWLVSLPLIWRVRRLKQVAEGLLERAQGKGTFVRRPRFDSSLFRFFRFQNQAGERRIPQGRVLGMEVTVLPAAVADRLRLPAGAAAIHLDRLRLMAGVPLLAESIWLPFDRFQALAGLRPDEFGDLLYPLYEERCGQTIASAEETLTAETVGPDHARLLGLKPGAPVMVIERLAFSFDHQPIEWRRSRGPADQFLYTATIR